MPTLSRPPDVLFAPTYGAAKRPPIQNPNTASVKTSRLNSLYTAAVAR